MRRPRWQDEGEDPGYQLSMANERTFLAWLRTALALMAGSVAVSQLLPAFDLPGGRTALGVLLAVLGAGVAAFAYLRWAATERAMRLSRPMRYPVTLVLLSSAMTGIGVLVVVLVIMGRK